MKRIFFIFLLFIFALVTANAAEIVGKWKTIDDGTGEVKSIVEITKKDGKLYGKIIKLFDKDPNYDPICDMCKDHLKNQKIIGMQIINGLTEKEGKWVGDKGILDPDNGKYYNTKIWVDEKNPSKLNVRGYIAFLYRTQTWLREK
jgi:uncharacterized protein (DUF2147 family)